MKRERQILAVIWRCLRLRCPVCGEQSIAGSPFKIRHHCPHCRALFQREEGFFVGAITINVITTELFILVLYFISLLLLSNGQTMLAILFVMGLLFPIAFYHHSWSIWLSLDHLIETLPHYRNADQHADTDMPGKR